MNTLPKHIDTVMILILALSSVSAAEEASIPWWKVSGGGGLSLADQVTLVGTIGQADAGLMTGGNAAIYGGFSSYEVEVSPPPTAITWTNTAGGNWLDAENWSPNKVPEWTGIAVINAPGTYTVTIDYYAECQALQLGGGPGIQTVDWSGGQFFGTMLVQTNGVLNLTDATIELDGVIENRGRVNWLAKSLAWRLEDNARFINRASGLLNLQGSGWLYSGSTLTRAVLNAGTIRKSQDPEPIEVSPGIAFVNAGVLEVQTGILRLASLTSSNSVMVADGAILEVYSGTVSFLPGHSFLGAGTCWFVESPTVKGVLGGQVLYTVSEGAVFDARLGATMWWTNGPMLGSMTIEENGVLKLAEASQYGVIPNYGRIDYTSEGNWGWRFYDGAVVENAPGGLLEVLADMTVNLPTGATFYNRGTVRKSGGAGTASFRGQNFINDGTFDVQSGVADFAEGLVSRGTINVAQNAELNFSAGSFRFGPDHTFTGGGTCILGGASIDGELAGTVDFRITYDVEFNARLNAQMEWDYGDLSGALTVGRQGVLTLATPGTLAGTITNLGTVLLPGGENSSWAWSADALFENAADALFEMQGDARFDAAGGGRVFNNAGTSRKAEGIAEGTFDSGFTFLNSGRLEALSGEVVFGGPYNQTTQGGILIGIGGSTPVTQYSRIRFETTPVLAGWFSAVATGTYKPALGARFTVLNYPSATGNFSSLNLDLSGGVALTPQFAPTALVLTTVESRPPSLTFTASTGSLRLTWPEGITGWHLYSTTNLADPQWELGPLGGGTKVDLEMDRPFEMFQLRKQ